MKTHPFGKTDLRVSEFGFGCARIGGIFQSGSGGFVDLVRAARDAGINFFDTSDMYSQGESESILGRAFRGMRDRVVIASKAGYVLPSRRKFVARLKPILRPIITRLGIRRKHLPAAARGTVTQDFSPRYLRGAVEGSLKRLRTDYLDLFQLHSPPLEVVERGDFNEVLEDLKRAGKLRYWGISCDSVDVGLAALRHSGVSSLQFVLNLLEPGSAEELLPRVRASGVAGIARETLANGLLIKEEADIDFGKYTSSPEEARRRRAELAKYRELAGKEGRSLARHALAFVRDREGVAVTLVGASTQKQLRALLKELPS